MTLSDIFSEGTDIVEVNQVIMLRPTQSPIVFIQQLGRGLRKYEDKEYVVVLDFIGNYNNNFMIPIALSGDRTYNKDNVRRYAHEGNRVIPGSSTIHFDEISRKRIFASIDQATIQDELEKNGSPRAEFFTDEDWRAMRIRIPIHPAFIEKADKKVIDENETSFETK